MSEKQQIKITNEEDLRVVIGKAKEEKLAHDVDETERCVVFHDAEEFNRVKKMVRGEGNKDEQLSVTSRRQWKIANICCLKFEGTLSSETKQN